MPYRVYWEHPGILVEYSGKTNDEEVADFAREGQADPRFCTLRYVLHDFSDAESATHSGRVIEELAATDFAASRTNPRVVIAVVAQKHDVLEMVKAYLEVGLSGYPLRTFHTVERARHWIRSEIHA